MARKELTAIEIALLPEPQRPGYLSSDEEGPYKIDKYGIKRRPFEKGGPSPNQLGRPKITREKIEADDLIADIAGKKGYDSVLETIYKVIHRDADTCRKLGIRRSDIKFDQQIRLLMDLLNYEHGKKAVVQPRRGLTIEQDLTDTYPLLDLPENGR